MKDLMFKCGVDSRFSIQSETCRDRILAALTALCEAIDNEQLSAEEILLAVFYRQGMNQSDLAIAAGVSRQRISYMLRNSKLAKRLRSERRKAQDKIRKRCYELYHTKQMPAREVSAQLGIYLCKVTQYAHEWAIINDLTWCPHGKRQRKRP